MAAKTVVRDSLVIDGLRYPVQIHLERRSNSRVSIGKRAIHIRLPLHMRAGEKASQIGEFKSWAKRTIEDNRGRLAPQFYREYHDGQTLNVGGQEYRLKIEYKAKKSSSAALQDGEVRLCLSSSLDRETRARHIAALLSRCIGRQRLPELKQRMQAINEEQFGRHIGTVRFRYNKSTWGSCSSKGNISISTRLLFAPDDVLDYVCVHELAHLVERNHSQRFWDLVAAAMPNYKLREAWLKENGGSCWF